MVFGLLFLHLTFAPHQHASAEVLDPGALAFSPVGAPSSPRFGANLALLPTAGGGILALLPRVRALQLAHALDALELFTPPVTLPSLRVAMAWHPRMKDDPLQLALRTTLAALVKGLVGRPRPARPVRPGGASPGRAR